MTEYKGDLQSNILTMVVRAEELAPKPFHMADFYAGRHLKPVVHGWWYRYWPKLACLAGVFVFWILFWWEASR